MERLKCAEPVLSRERNQNVVSSIATNDYTPKSHILYHAHCVYHTDNLTVYDDIDKAFHIATAHTIPVK